MQPPTIIQLFLIGLFLFFGAGHAFAQSVEFSFSGEVRSTTFGANPGFTANGGDPLTGIMIYDFATSDDEADASEGDYPVRDGYWYISITLNGTTFSSAASAPYFNVSVHNNHATYGDIFSVISANNAPLASGVSLDTIYFVLYDEDADALSSDALPTAVLDLSKWSDTSPPGYPYIAGGHGTAQEFAVSFEITAINAPQVVQYFPHVDCAGNWRTEIGIVNNSSASSEVGLKTYRSDGTQNPDGMLLHFQAHSAWVRDVCSSFASPEEIGYLALTTEGSGVMGYTRFAHHAGSAGSLPLSSPTTSGILDRLDAANLTGVVFVNTSEIFSTPVALTAYGSAGNIIETTTLTVGPGAKQSAFVTDIFTANLSQAAVIGYSSPLPVVAFYLNLSADYTEVDGLPGR